MASTTFFLWPKMKLLNQRRFIQRSEPKTSAGTGTGATAGIDLQRTYDGSDFTCAPVAAAMAVRSVIEHSGKRFNNLKTTEPLRPGTPNSVTIATPLPITDATTIDFYDVALVNFWIDLMGYRLDKGPPGIPPSVTKDGDKTTGLGLLAGMESQFKASVGASGSITGTRVKSITDQFNITKNLRSYPRVKSSEIFELMNQGNVVVLGLDFVKPRMKNGQFELDKQGNKIWRQTGIAHAVVVNGFGIHNQKGDLFRIYDPLGIPPNVGATVIGLRVFTALQNGMVEYVKLSEDDTETAVFENLADAAGVSEVHSVKDDAKHGHPIWIFNPFDKSPVTQNFAGRILTSITTLKIGNDKEFLVDVDFDDSELIGPGIVDGQTGLSGTTPQAPKVSKAKPAKKTKTPSKKAKTKPGKFKAPGKK